MKTLNVLFFAAFILFFSQQTINAQAPGIEWQKCFGGSSTDELHAVQPTTDGGFILAGETQSDNGQVTFQNGWSDGWVVKISNNGTIQWQKSYGGPQWEHIYDIKQTSDGGYVFVGSSDSDTGDLTNNYGWTDVWIVKLNSTGNIQWQRSYGGSSADNPRSIIQTSDGGYAVCGYSWSSDHDVDSNLGEGDVWVLKVNSTGNIQWKKSLGSSEYDDASMIQETSDGGYILAGYAGASNGDVTGHHGNMDAWAIKLSSTGVLEWQKCYGGSNSEWFSTVRQTADGGFIFFGDTDSDDEDVNQLNGASDMWIVKTTSTGTIEWEKTIGGSNYEEGTDIRLTNDGGYIVTGYTASNDIDVSGNHGEIDVWVVKLDGTGQIQWQKCLGGTGEDDGISITPTTDNGYLVVGITNSDDDDVTDAQGDYDGWAVKLAGTVSVDETIESSFSVYPNPAKDNIIIRNIERGSSISIHDITGKLVHQSVVNDVQTTISTIHLPGGVYFVQLKNNNKVSSQKLVIDK